MSRYSPFQNDGAGASGANSAGVWASLQRWAWLPAPLAVAVVATFWIADLRTSYESWTLELWVCAVFSGLVSLGIVFLAGRGFLASGQPAALMFGCGVLWWGMGTITAVFLLDGGKNLTVTVQNLSMFGASACHLAGLLWLGRLQRRGGWLAAACVGVLAAVALTVWAAMAGWTPLFFAEGRGGTPARQITLGLAICMLVMTVWLLMGTYRALRAFMVYWYGLGLSLLAVGVLAVMLQSVQGDVLGWTGRGAMCLGSVYLLVTALVATRQGHGNGVSLSPVESGRSYRDFVASVQDRGESQTTLRRLLRYGVAVAVVAAAFGFRQAATAWVGPGLPIFVTFFPAVMMVALVAGLGPGLLATVLSLLVVVFWILPSGSAFALDALTPMERMGLVLFAGMGVFMCVVAELYERRRIKAAAYDREEALRKSRAALQASEAEFRSLAESMPQIVWVCRPDGWNIYFNHQWMDYTGLTLEESLGHGWNVPFHPDDKQRAWDAWQRATRHGDTYSTQCRLRRADGVYRWWLIRGLPHRDANGEILKWFGTCTDIDDIKRAEEEARHLNAQLAEANKELESFSYSVSHDLRSPLRGIHGFANILTEDYAKLLDDEGRRVLGIIRSEAQRMGNLIDDLLAFSRLGRRAMQMGEVDMTALAQTAYRECAAQANGRDIRFTLHPLPSARGDSSLLGQVWANLISNAFKYTSQRAPAVIEVGYLAAGHSAEEGVNGHGSLGKGHDQAPMTNDQITFFVRDNGAGFDMRYVGKLFGVFQRLHTEEEFEGTGVGLALVQRIVHRHGGCVWAEGEVNKGATFYFTLPASQGRMKNEE